MSYASEYRVGFGAELDVSKLFVHVDDTENFDENSFAPVAERFNKYGVAVLVCKERPEPRVNSVALKQYFGNVILHDRANEDGIVPIDPPIPSPAISAPPAPIIRRTPTAPFRWNRSRC